MKLHIVNEYGVDIITAMFEVPDQFTCVSSEAEADQLAAAVYEAFARAQESPVDIPFDVKLRRVTDIQCACIEFWLHHADIVRDYIDKALAHDGTIRVTTAGVQRLEVGWRRRAGVFAEHTTVQ